ncbi:glycosyl hydrolase [Streptomyces sp. NPDC093085]|uniref:glycosyl hydrolase n=1 Tax=Streptomyces sp. NPDC093085 TaxID=3155068 RepID=UPI003430739E
MTREVDLRLDGLAPVDDASAFAYGGIWPSALTPIVEYHTNPTGIRSYLAAHDDSVAWGTPSDPQIIAISIERDYDRDTFTFETAYHATVSFAQNWLIEHGGPPERIAQVSDAFKKPADNLTTQVEQKLRTSGARYKVLDSHTSDYGPYETWTLTRDTGAAQAPVRVFLEAEDFNARAYTLREGAFADEDAARRWLTGRDSPLPQPPEYGSENAALRTRAALTRSAGASATPKAGIDTPDAPSAGTAQRPAPRRLM